MKSVNGDTDLTITIKKDKKKHKKKHKHDRREEDDEEGENGGALRIKVRSLLPHLPIELVWGFKFEG